jgi:DNA-binding transcriptional ArsR family regulator
MGFRSLIGRWQRLPNLLPPKTTPGVHAMTDKKTAETCAEKLQAIAEPNRIRIIECLRTKSMNVTELAKALNVEIVNVSHHLGVLRSAELVQDEKNGRFVIYSLHPKYFTNEGNKATFLDLGWCRIEIPHN